MKGNTTVFVVFVFWIVDGAVGLGAVDDSGAKRA